MKGFVFDSVLGLKSSVGGGVGERRRLLLKMTVEIGGLGQVEGEEQKKEE